MSFLTLDPTWQEEVAEAEQATRRFHQTLKTSIPGVGLCLSYRVA